MADVIATHAEIARAGVDKFFPIFSQHQRRIYRLVDRLCCGYRSYRGPTMP